MLDAEKCTSKLWRAATDDIKMRQAIENLHSRAAHEEGRL